MFSSQHSKDELTARIGMVIFIVVIVAAVTLSLWLAFTGQYSEAWPPSSID